MTQKQRLYLPSLTVPVDMAAAGQVWAEALCAQTDPELFFPTRGDSKRSRQALAVCSRCPVVELCHETFGPVIEHGVVGGRTAIQREALRRRRAA